MEKSDQKRQLAAIMFTDIEGYTALMQHDEEKANLIRERHRQVFKPITEDHEGKILQYYGDGTLSMFSSTLDAVKCGVEMQQAFLDNPSIPVRIGIHVGDVLVTEDDIFGDAVNIASRIESLGKAGSVLISEKVNDEIKNHVGFKTVSLGHFPFKNVDEPIKVLALANEGLTVPDSNEMLDKGKVIKKDIPTNLPNPATRFFGREQELKQLKELLAKERLVTLQGSGGCGKTRLAIEAARQSLNLYPDGVWFVSLAPLTDPELVADTLAETLQVKPQKDKSIEEKIVDRISKKKLLVVIDNCEHLIDECARILNLLIDQTQDPLFLVTSREAINIPGEATFQIPSLPFPETTAKLDEIIGFDSIQLFRDRVLLNKPGFQLDESNGHIVSSICQRLDGIPLAIEMAASRVKILEPAAILDRLSHHFNLLSSDIRTAPPRHQTLIATIDWSNELLTEDERTLFYRLSVFTGDFDLDDAEKVCGYAPLEEFQVLDLLTHLVDKSLIITIDKNGTVRYSLLEIMKQYGVEKLSQKRELSVLEEHYCNYYMDKTAIAYKERMNNSLKWLPWIALELNNLQGALKLLQNDPDKRLELASSLSDFMYIQANTVIGREILIAALESVPKRNIYRARTLNALGFLELFYMNSELGYQKMKDANDIIQELGDKQGKLDTYCWYGMAKTIHEEWEEAQKILVEGLEIAKAYQNPWMEIRFKMLATWIPINQLKPELIEDQVEEHLSKAKKLGHPYDITVSYHIYADVPLQKGDFKLAEIRYIDAAKSAMALGSILQADIELQGVAMAVSGQGRHEKGLRLFGAAIGKFEEIGAELISLNFWMTCINNTVGKAIEAVGPEKAKALDLEGRQMGFEEALEYAYDVEKD